MKAYGIGLPRRHTTPKFLRSWNESIHRILILSGNSSPSLKEGLSWSSIWESGEDDLNAFWVFLNQHINPYWVLHWTKDFVECTLSSQAEKTMWFGETYYGTQEQGIFQFHMCIEESLICLQDRRIFQMVYRDHCLHHNSLSGWVTENPSMVQCMGSYWKWLSNW